MRCSRPPRDFELPDLGLTARIPAAMEFAIRMENRLMFQR